MALFRTERPTYRCVEVRLVKELVAVIRSAPALATEIMGKSPIVYIVRTLTLDVRPR